MSIKLISCDEVIISNRVFSLITNEHAFKIFCFLLTCAPAARYQKMPIKELKHTLRLSEATLKKGLKHLINDTHLIVKFPRGNSFNYMISYEGAHLAYSPICREKQSLSEINKTFKRSPNNLNPAWENCWSNFPPAILHDESMGSTEIRDYCLARSRAIFTGYVEKYTKKKKISYEGILLSDNVLLFKRV